MDEQTVWHVVHHVPNKELLDKFKAKCPAEYHRTQQADENALINTCTLAVKSSYKQLEMLRHDGIPTHANGHAVAHCFKKCLDIYRSQYRDFPMAFRDILWRYLDSVSEALKPVLEVFDSGIHFYPEFKGDDRTGSAHYGGLSKREKETLFRAFWPTLSEAWDNFANHDWLAEYAVLWELALEHFKAPVSEPSTPPRFEEGSHITELDVEGTELLGGEPVTPPGRQEKTEEETTK